MAKNQIRCAEIYLRTPQIEQLEIQLNKAQRMINGDTGHEHVLVSVLLQHHNAVGHTYIAVFREEPRPMDVSIVSHEELMALPEDFSGGAMRQEPNDGVVQDADGVDWTIGRVNGQRVRRRRRG